MSKPVIGIVAWRRGLRTPLGDPEVLHALSDAYVSAFDRAGMLPLIIPNGRPLDEVGSVLDRIDGLALSGGGDVHPSSYGAPNESSEGIDAEVDAWEIGLLDCARRRGVPTLCICRGIQILSVAHGGTLRQHILEDGTQHEPLRGKSAQEILTSTHAVTFTPGGRLERIYGTNRVPVNTIHHQAIDVLGEGLVIEAVAPDGIIEAVASSDPAWWAVGVQWHPERTMDDVDKPLFDAFAAEVAR